MGSPSGDPSGARASGRGVGGGCCASRSRPVPWFPCFDRRGPCGLRSIPRARCGPRRAFCIPARAALQFGIEGPRSVAHSALPLPPRLAGRIGRLAFCCEGGLADRMVGIRRQSQANSAGDGLALGGLELICGLVPLGSWGGPRRVRILPASTGARLAALQTRARAVTSGQADVALDRSQGVVCGGVLRGRTRSPQRPPRTRNGRGDDSVGGGDERRSPVEE